MNETFLKNGNEGRIARIGRRARWFAGVVALTAAVALAAWLRFDGLGEKPMHHDEAEQAFTLGKLLDGQGYRYTKEDHHGPTLYYLAAWLARASGRDSLAALDAASLRVLPAAFGVLLVAIPLLWLRRRRDGGGVVSPRAAASMERGRPARPAEVDEAADNDGTGIPACPATTDGTGRNVCPTLGVERGGGGVSLVAVAAAVALGATSPTAVYYARYFVQETIFAACFWGCVPLLWAALRRRRGGESGTGVPPVFRAADAGVAALAGVLFGVAVASKETWVLMAMAAGIGAAAVLACELFLRNLRGDNVSAGDAIAATATATASSAHNGWRVRVAAPLGALCGEWRAWLAPCGVFAFVALAVAVSFFSSFGANPAGLADSVLTYGAYFDKAFDSPHDKPFGWYWATFAGAHRYGNVRFVLEMAAFAGALALAPLLFARSLWSRAERRVGVFSLAAGAALFLIYSALRYKTPWLVPGMLPPLWMASGLAFAGFLRLASRPRWLAARAVLCVAVCAVFAAGVFVSWKSAVLLTSTRFATHERNPLAYVHSTRDVQEIEELARRVAPFAPAAREPVFACVFSREYGPLLWALREWKAGRPFEEGGRVWIAAAPPAQGLLPGGLPDPPVLITDDFSEPLVAPRLTARYLQIEEVLRPGRTLHLRIREDLWKKAEPPESAGAR